MEWALYPARLVTPITLMLPLWPDMTERFKPLLGRVVYGLKLIVNGLIFI